MIILLKFNFLQVFRHCWSARGRIPQKPDTHQRLLSRHIQQQKCHRPLFPHIERAARTAGRLHEIFLHDKSPCALSAELRAIPQTQSVPRRADLCRPYRPDDETQGRTFPFPLLLRKADRQHQNARQRQVQIHQSHNVPLGTQGPHPFRPIQVRYDCPFLPYLKLRQHKSYLFVNQQERQIFSDKINLFNTTRSDDMRQ